MILLTGDWHVHNFPQFSRPWKPGLNTRARDIFKVVGESLPRAMGRYQDPVLFCHMGDFNFRASNDYRLVNLTLEAVRACTMRAGQAVACHGNHDTVSDSPSDHNAFPYMQESHWQPYYWAIDKCLVWPVGYNSQLPNPEELLKTKAEHILVMLHKDVEGGRASTGFIYSAKRQVSYRALLELKKAVPAVVYFNGHYHDQQIIRKLVCVVGAPVQHRRSDEGLKRGFVTYEPETKKIKFVELLGPHFVTCTAETMDQYSKSPEECYITVKVKNDAEKRKANEWRRDTKVTAVIKEDLPVLEDKGKLVQFEEGTAQVSDAELLDKWLAIKAPDLSAKQRAELVRVGEAL